MTAEQLAQAVRGIMMMGPDRVVINGHGEAVPPRRAREDHAVSAEIIFIRDDGWSLGAPTEYSAAAEALWPESWIGVLVRPSTVALDYATWKAAQG